jgi:acyl carrier protein
MYKEEIFATIKKLLTEKFEVKSDLISPEKLLVDELDLDSLDAVDLLIYLGSYINGKLDPALFKDAKTVLDLVNILEPLWKGSE